MQKRHTEARKLPAKPAKLKCSQLPRKDVMRNQTNRDKIGSVQNISNPVRSSSNCFAEKIVHSQILDGLSNVYKDRQINFEKQKLTGKINEYRANGFVAARKVARQVEVPIKLGNN